jgi:arginine deiminase
MANKVREREALIMETIFSHHPLFETGLYNPFRTEKTNPDLKMEGGDILVARDDILLMGIGTRTSSQGVDYLLDQLKDTKDKQHIIIQELPSRPESFIHLDMAFTLLDRDHCMVYEPLIITPNRYATVHIEMENGKVKINNVKSIPDKLRELGMDLKISFCGGKNDPVTQEREQWHSGANFFAFAPGKIIGYSRNVYTLDELDRNGFQILKARDVADGNASPDHHKRCVVIFDGSELARGGGGARCMTMPVRRTDPGF